MSGTRIKPPEHLTIESLRAYLDAIEAAWTKQDATYFGDFNKLKIHTPHKISGISPAHITFNGGFDILIYHK